MAISFILIESCALSTGSSLVVIGLLVTGHYAVDTSLFTSLTFWFVLFHYRDLSWIPM